jgi:AAA domain
VGDDRQFAPVDAGGGFRALRLRLGAAELTVNRRQVEPWEQQALDDVRAGRVQEAIAAYAEHERIRAFEATDERDRALLGDFWQAHQAGEAPVIYAHRRAQVDRLNLLCQRLRAQAGELGGERLAVGDRQFGVGDQVVLGANALQRLGVANGTSAVVVGVDVRGRALIVRTTEDKPPRTVRLPGWYLDAAVAPGGSRRVDLAYARTDMRSQGRTEQRALLALDGAEDMQGFYVQLSRSKERTDLYLTVGPVPLGIEEAHAHPRGEPVEPEQLLGRVMRRDGGKTLASDTPDAVDVRRWSTRQLREERDQIQAARAECPADRSRELVLAQRRAADLEEARRQALAELKAARAAAGRDPARDGLRPQHAAADREPPGGPAAPSRPAAEDPSRPAAEDPSRPARPASRPVPGRPGWHRRQRDPDDTAQDRPAGRDRERGRSQLPAHGAGLFGAVLGRQPGRDRPGQRRDWHAVRAALDRLAQQRERLGRGDRQDRAGHPDRDRRHLKDRDRHERDGR